MHCLTIFLLCLVAPLAISKSVAGPTCGPVCAIFCAFGNVRDENGCPTCKCKNACEDGQTPLAGYFCGRGPNRRECPSTHRCVIAPNDAFAVCCPHQQQVQENE